MNDKGSISKDTGIFTRDFLLISIAFFIFQAAYMALIPAVAIYFTKLGSNESEVGVLVGIMGIAALVSRFFVGAILTRYSEKKVMLFGIALSALALLAYIVFRPFWTFFIVRVIQGIGFASVHTAAFTYAVKTISPARRGQGLAYFTLSTFLAMAVAAPFGLFLVNRYSFTLFFLTFASLCLCSFLLSWVVKEGETIGAHRQNIQSYSTTFVEWKIVVPGIAAFLQMFVYGALAAFFPLYALQCGVTNPGLFFTAIGLVTVAGRAFGGRILDTCNKEKMIVTLILIMMVAMGMLSFSNNLPMFIFVGLLYGTGMTFFMPVSMVYALEYSGSSGGPGVATFNASFDLGVALGPAIMGLVVPLTGYPVMFLSLAFICFINLCYFQFYVRKRRNVVPTA
jgi:predicted MFS family arabinose efflux permease